MKNNQVYLDPQNLEGSLRQLQRFYRLDDNTLDMLRRVIENYPRPVIVYVDEANAPMMAASPLDDLFTFNMQTGELILFSADPKTFIDAIIEMHMFIAGFETHMGANDQWHVEFAIGAWKPVKNIIKKRLKIPNDQVILGIVGLPPEPDEMILEDPYPFKTLVSSLNIVSFIQMVRLAAREEIRVHFPPESDPRVVEVYHIMRQAMQKVGADLDITDVETFNERLNAQIKLIETQYQPNQLPMPEGWQRFFKDNDAASGSESPSDDDENGVVGLMLGPENDDEPSFGQLTDFEKQNPDYDPDFIDYEEDIFAILEDALRETRLATGPFGRFINTLFEDEEAGN